jgi:hypothetical protein
MQACLICHNIYYEGRDTERVNVKLLLQNQLAYRHTNNYIVLTHVSTYEEEPILGDYNGEGDYCIHWWTQLPPTTTWGQQPPRVLQKGTTYPPYCFDPDSHGDLIDGNDELILYRVGEGQPSPIEWRTEQE